MHVSGISTPTSSPHNLQLGIRISDTNFHVLYPAIETVTNAKKSVGSSSAAGAQLLVSFVTSLPVHNICGPIRNNESSFSSYYFRSLLHIKAPGATLPLCATENGFHQVAQIIIGAAAAC